MSGRVALRHIAACLVVLSAICGGPGAATAQWQINMAAIDSAVPSNLPSPATEPFGLDVLPVTAGDVTTKWNGVAADIRAESEVLAVCREDAKHCPAAAQKFLAVIAEGRAQAGRARIGVVNRAINLAVAPMSDLAQWGEPDVWSAPLQTLATGRGDCEDYAIAKYVALKEAGIAGDDVRLVIVRDLTLGQDHAVVAVRSDGGWIMLDNRWLTLVRDIELPRVVPLFVIDDNGVKQFAPIATADARPAIAPVQGPAASPGAFDF